MRDIPNKLEWGITQTTVKVFHYKTKQPRNENEGQVIITGHLTILTAKLADIAGQRQHWNSCDNAKQSTNVEAMREYTQRNLLLPVINLD